MLLFLGVFLAMCYGMYFWGWQRENTILVLKVLAGCLVGGVACCMVMADALVFKREPDAGSFALLASLAAVAGGLMWWGLGPYWRRKPRLSAGRPAEKLTKEGERVLDRILAKAEAAA